MVMTEITVLGGCVEIIELKCYDVMQICSAFFILNHLVNSNAIWLDYFSPILISH